MVALGSAGRVAAALGLLTAPVLASTSYTAKHEKGRCAVRGQCEPDGFFGPGRPCADNGKAKDPEDELRTRLVDLCGDSWSKGPVCCEADQVDALTSSLSKADVFIASCPACKTNFYNLFCSFTCSPDQSTFINVTRTESKAGKQIVDELDQLWSDDYLSTFFDSCKDVKFGATNTPAMSFIGGGATNYSQFLSYLGDKKAIGSPFQINFPSPSKGDWEDMEPLKDEAHPCNSTDLRYRCTCVDCPGTCTELPALQQEEACHVGAWPCLTFAVVLIYALSLFLLILAMAGHVAYRKHTQHRNERLRLLQDTASDDEDDGDQDLAYQFNHTSGPTRKYWINTFCDRSFSKLGRICARYPALTIGISFVVVGLLSLGWIRFQVERDPVRLWVAPDSAAAQEKEFFDTHFGPFFRTEQAFLVNDTLSSEPGPVLSYDTLRWWFDVEGRVSRLKSRRKQTNFQEICYNPTHQGCVVQSVSAYWDSNFANVPINSWQKDLEQCVATPSECLPSSGAPVDPKLVLGGFTTSPLEAKSLITTWVVNNAQDGDIMAEMAADWEDDMKNLMQIVQVEAAERGLRVSFNTEASLEQELNKTTNTDTKIIVISYIVMFIYASIALGSTTFAFRQVLKNPATALVQSKFMLGVVGIVIVLFSVSASVGLFSAAGVKVTLIIAEVIPFLVLAIGVDNIFLIVHEFERVNNSYPNELVEERMAKALGRMGPSILLSAAMETIAFALGAFVGMPAVRNFAVYAAGAVVINALLQITMFVAALALNQQRVEAGRADCVPCIQIQQAIALPYDEGVLEDSGLQHFIRRVYAPALLGRKTKVAIVTIFLGLFTAGIALLPSVKLGLDQRIAIPDDSYLIPYFNDLYDYLDVGPPVYFVTKDMNITSREGQQQVCGRFSTCNAYSLSNVIEQESHRPEVSFISASAASWVDDFFLWLNPRLTQCCVDEVTERPCFADRDPGWNLSLAGMPEGAEYLSYLKAWTASETTQDCPLGGQASYSTAVVIPAARNPLTIPASHFRTSHTPLRSQDDFINAYKSARRIADDISNYNEGASVFAYSKFYIFFDQYLSIVRLSITLLSAALVACFLVCSLLLGSLRTGAVVALVVGMTIVDIAGAMALADVSLNAVTLVNLVISVGIAVEFCAHIARAFQFPAARLLADASVVAASSTPTAGSSTGLFSLLGAAAKSPRLPRFGRQLSSFSSARLAANPAAMARSNAAAMRDARAWAALTQVGGSVFSGITLTKLLGVAVLAFSRSKIFEVYYFRVWLALVVLAALHALVFLPVALSLAGGKEGWVGDESRIDDPVGVQDDLRRRMRGYLDFEGESDDGY